jgi:hypothetical protein
MVDLTDKVEAIRVMVDQGSYFTINRARQYGKTTLLAMLTRALRPEYVVVSTSFEGIGDDGFRDERSFVTEFCRLLKREFRRDEDISDKIKKDIDDLFARDNENLRLGDLFDVLLEWCDISDKEIVLIIDEVDSATNNQVFLDFLAQLRADYLEREDDPEKKTFQSVILAGVTDVKHIRSKIRPEDEHKENSPWNIAADFTIDMSLSENGIKGMLDEYEADHHTGMDTAVMAKSIRDYTNGYPFLVSRICQLLDEEVSKTMSLSDA